MLQLRDTWGKYNPALHKDLSEVDVLNMLYGIDAGKRCSRPECDRDGDRDGGTDALKSGSMGDGRIELAFFSGDSLTDVQVGRGSRLLPHEWRRRQVVRQSGCVFLANSTVTSGWAVAFPVTTTGASMGPASVRQRFFIIPINALAPSFENIKKAPGMRALRDMCFAADQSDDEDAEGDSAAYTEDHLELSWGFDELSVEQVLRAFLMAFVAATAVKIYLFFVRCPHSFGDANKSACGDVTVNVGATVADLGMCFLYGPLGSK